jgi:hypothetical protein
MYSPRDCRSFNTILSEATKVSSEIYGEPKETRLILYTILVYKISAVSLVKRKPTRATESLR